ncbi:hypothetical protein GCM10011309_17760 [Litorimonas cladophorae]|uniref:Uncharacterized protein n=1 Tax=Litorimonas cladophorae TaxID=1220491 RepID=A0A918KM39_9PROT|nr:hypothetical protein GCM10011309_17760 [Litorimonas cladophorae]
MDPTKVGLSSGAPRVTHRDKLDCSGKRIYAADLTFVAANGTASKTLVKDMLASRDFAAGAGLTSNILEALSVLSGGRASVVNDNDSVGKPVGWKSKRRLTVKDRDGLQAFDDQFAIRIPNTHNLTGISATRGGKF